MRLSKTRSPLRGFSPARRVCYDQLTMLGAIAGDVIGSVHERRPTKTTRLTLFDERCRVTDDTVMTVATARAILQADVARAAGRGADK